jgi:hypothetical protein
MPYANREDKIARQRQRRREQREQQAQWEARSSPQIAAPRITRTPPAPSLNHDEPRRADLLRTYQDLRGRGLDETAAKTELQRQRNQQRRQTEQQRQKGQLQALALLKVGEARRRLSMGGSYGEDEIWPAALQLARAELRQRQRPRLPDPTPKRLAAPMPKPPHVQRAGPVWTGRLAPARLSLGDGYAAQREVSRSMVHALLATLLRQPAAAVVQTVETTMLPVSPVGVPGALGAPVAGESWEWEE